MGRVIRLTAVLGAICCSMLLTGCAYGDRSVTLQYDPVVGARAQQKTEIGVTKFVDHRQEVAVGEVRDGHGAQTAMVYATDQDLGGWVANALADELTTAGVDVVKFSDTASSDIPTVISGEVTKAYVGVFLGQLFTAVKARITLTRADGSVLDKEYVGKNWQLQITISTGQYEKALKAALQDLMKKAVPEVVGAI